eukprot:114581-Amphidinium_carterae.1
MSGTLIMPLEIEGRRECNARQLDTTLLQSAMATKEPSLPQHAIVELGDNKARKTKEFPIKT